MLKVVQSALAECWDDNCIVAIFLFLNSILRGHTHLSEALKNEVELHQKADYLDGATSLNMIESSWRS
jgi:hypothetical protein